MSVASINCAAVLLYRRSRALSCISSGWLDIHFVNIDTTNNRYYSSTPSLLKGGPKTKIHRAEKRRLERDRIGKDKVRQQIQKVKRNTQDAPKKSHDKQRSKQPQLSTKKNPLPGPYSAFISCLPGLEPILLQEVEYLQSQWQKYTTTSDRSSKVGAPKAIPGGVKIIVPELIHLYILHLYLGTASHIYLRLNDDDNVVNGGLDIPPLFRARGFPELKRKVKDLILSQQWKERLFLMDMIPSGASSYKSKRSDDGKQHNLPWQLQVHVTTSKSKLMHTKAVEQRVRETIEDVLGIDDLKIYRSDDNSSSGDDTEDSRPIVRFLVRVERDMVQLSLDSSSSNSATPLHMRGYRLDPYKAPLREDLSFAMLLAGGLKPAWNLDPLRSLLPNHGNTDGDSGSIMPKEAMSSVQLFDPLCGSGTIAIEGASILAGLPPGRFRPPPFQGTRLCNPNLWNEVKSKALSLSITNKSKDGNNKDDTNSTILVAANDINKHAIKVAQANAKRAGVDKFIDFAVGSFKLHPVFKNSMNEKSTSAGLSLASPLLLITNPPYGKRLSTRDSQPSTYKQIAKSISSSQIDINCTLIGKDPRSMRESSLPLKVAFSTKQGGLNVVVMTDAK